MKYLLASLLFLSALNNGHAQLDLDIGTDPFRMFWGFYPVNISGPLGSRYFEWGAEYIYAHHYRDNYWEANRTAFGDPTLDGFLRRGHKGVAALRLYPFGGGERRGGSVGVFYRYAHMREFRGGMERRREHTYGFEFGRKLRGSSGIVRMATFGIGGLKVYAGSKANRNRRLLGDEVAQASMYMTIIFGFGTGQYEPKPRRRRWLF